MIISLIVAMDYNRLIGANNGLPWRLPDDMRWFVERTMGKPVIMGRKTYNSIPAKFRPLHGRHNIIITRNPDYEAVGCTVVHSLAAALAAAGDVPEVIIGGGAQIYAKALPLAHRLYLTLIDGEFTGDAYFPPLDPAEWRETFRQEHEPDARHGHRFTWLIWARP
ncbi:MAG: dihydrofolate reductase [Anaerolineae bacterium]|nr:dihydrofolate reductase [Anaerolineae bacterium]